MVRRAPRPDGRALGRSLCSPPSIANSARIDSIPVEAFLVSAGVIALGEIGDKTQLLALLLAARFRKPLPIVAGILVATLANHALAGFVGNLFRAFVPDEILRWLLALVVLRRRDLDAQARPAGRREAPPTSRWGVFGVTTLAFFLAEMGDKTQIATVVMAAQYSIAHRSRARHDVRNARRRRAGRAARQRRIGEDSIQGSANRRGAAVRGDGRLRVVRAGIAGPLSRRARYFAPV